MPSGTFVVRGSLSIRLVLSYSDYAEPLGIAHEPARDSVRESGEFSSDEAQSWGSVQLEGTSRVHNADEPVICANNDSFITSQTVAPWCRQR
jgi:hypothetical protein